MFVLLGGRRWSLAAVLLPDCHKPGEIVVGFFASFFVFILGCPEAQSLFLRNSLSVEGLKVIPCQRVVLGMIEQPKEISTGKNGRNKNILRIVCECGSVLEMCSNSTLFWILK